MRLLLPQWRLQLSFLVIFGLYLHLVAKTNSSQIRRFASTHAYKYGKGFEKDSPNHNKTNEVVNLRRQKRDAIQLAILLRTGTNYTVQKLLGYGHYCGVGGDRAGDGSVIDKCDDCCKSHDDCYDDAMYTKITELDYDAEDSESIAAAKNIRQLNCIPYVLTYRVANISGDPHCIPDKVNSSGTEEASCASKICICDLELVSCLQKEPCPLF